MNISINEKTKDYIKKKTNDNSVNVSVIETSTGWIPFHEPTVELGKPSKEKDFDLYEVDDIKVYVLKGLREKGKVTITLGHYLWIKILRVEGLTN